MRMNFHKYNKFNWLHFSLLFLTHVVRGNNFAIKLILSNLVCSPTSRVCGDLIYYSHAPLVFIVGPSRGV